MEDQIVEKSFLPMREWAFVLIMLFVLSFLSTISFVKKSELCLSRIPTFEILVTGEVEKEQVLSLPHGATYADALAQVKLTKSADIDNLPFDAELKQGQIFVIPKSGVISIYLKGEVKSEGILYLTIGATFLDLQKNLDFKETADLKSLKRKRRKLKDGETVVIACK
jgi:hypothetical protein